MWLQHAESRYHLELSGVVERAAVERAAGALSEEKSCLKRDSIICDTQWSQDEIDSDFDQTVEDE